MSWGGAASPRGTARDVVTVAALLLPRGRVICEVRCDDADMEPFRPAVRKPYLDAVQAELLSVSPGLQGTLWERTSGNLLDTSFGDWILQVPDCWGWASDKDIPKGADKRGVKLLLEKIESYISVAQRCVDITGFGPPKLPGSPAEPFPDGRFLDAICAGLKQASISFTGDDRLIVRIMTGVPRGDFTADPWDFSDLLKRKLGPAADCLDLRVASMTTRGVSSYNHTKFILVDGRRVIHGGINWMTNFYIEDGDGMIAPGLGLGLGDRSPVVDLDISLAGPAALSAGKYLDMLWGWIWDNGSKNSRKSGKAWIAVDDFVTKTAWPGPGPGAVYGSGSVPYQYDLPGALDVISVGSLGYGILDKDPKAWAYTPPPVDKVEQAATGSNNETNTDRDFMTVNPDANAIRALVASAKKKIVLSQQDITGLTSLKHALFDVRLIDVLAEKMTASVKVQIVISNPGSPDYSNVGGDKIDIVSKVLFDRVRLKSVSDEDAYRVLQRNLQLATLRVSDQPTWPSKKKYRLHTKLVVVDDIAFYIGSRNAYPDTTQDHGFIIEDAEAVKQLNEKFLDKQWRYSKNAAIYDWERR